MTLPLRTDPIRGLHCAPGAEQCAVLLRLLAAALTPLVRQTHAWIASGLLHDPASEFFIMQGAALGPDTDCSLPGLRWSILTAFLLCH